MGDDLRKRGIEYLLSQRSESKKEHEMTARELAPILHIASSSVYDHMDTLVKSGKWGTRMAFDEELNKPMRVWWFISE